MNHLFTEADAGSVLIGNDTTRYQVHNGYGDGLVHVYTDVTDADKREIAEHRNVDEWELEGVTHGTTHIYLYDCLYNHETGELIQEKPLATLEGRYAIYSGKGLYMKTGVVIFVKWP